jgi:hypothetical protein
MTDTDNNRIARIEIMCATIINMLNDQHRTKKGGKPTPQAPIDPSSLLPLIPVGADRARSTGDIHRRTKDAGIRISETKLYACLATLADRGLIIRTDGGYYRDDNGQPEKPTIDLPEPENPSCFG